MIGPKNASKSLIPFCGYPIFKISTDDILTKEELAFLKLIPEQSDIPNEEVKLLEGSNILENSELHRIKNIIWNHFDDYVRNVLEIKNKFYMCNSWGAIQKKGNHHPKHTHPNAIFSSVFYVNAPNSSITFLVEKSKIQEGFYFDYEVESYNKFNAGKWVVPVESGDIIFFPGELAHETGIHKESDDRIVIGSSYFANGIYGEHSHYNRINLQNDR